MNVVNSWPRKLSCGVDTLDSHFCQDEFQIGKYKFLSQQSPVTVGQKLDILEF